MTAISMGDLNLIQDLSREDTLKAIKETVDELKKLLTNGSSGSRIFTVAPATGEVFDVDGPLTDTQLRASNVGVTASNAFGLEATQADVRTALQVMDDWDETDRAKVNLIAGQAGIAGGSGVVGANVPRVTLVTDVGLPTGTNSIGSIVPNRPSQGSGRTYKTGQLSVQTADATVYTVTAGKTLYVTTLNIAAFNTSTVTSGDLALRDGNGGTVLIPTLMTAAGVAAQLAASAAVSNLFLFAEPLQLTNAFYMDIISGTITYSVSFVGYEQ